MLQPSYEIFLDTAIRAISLRELVGAVRPVESLRVSRGFQERLHAWALAQLERRDATSTQQLLQFLTRWLVKLCTAEQVVTWWLRAVDAANSWSFLLASLPAASAASGCDERLHARVAELLEGDTCATPARADAVLLAFAALWPQKVLSQVGIAAWLPLSRRRASPPPSVVSGTLASARTAESAAHINDALAPEAEMARVLAAHPLMHKTKTKREFEQLEDWVLRLEPRLLRAAPVQARLVELPCSADGLRGGRGAAGRQEAQITISEGAGGGGRRRPNASIHNELTNQLIRRGSWSCSARLGPTARGCSSCARSSRSSCSS